MGNHNIDCEYCGQDTRGLGAVRGCGSALEASKCYSFTGSASDGDRWRMAAAGAREIEEAESRQKQAAVPASPSSDRDTLASIIAAALIGAGHGSAIGIGVYQRIADAVIRYYDERSGK